MMYAKNKDGRAIELQVHGTYGDDIEITEAFYLDDPEEEVTEKDIDFVYCNYSDEMYEEWLNSNISLADNYFEQMKQGDY